MEKGGSNRVACNFEMDSIPPTNSPLPFLLSRSTMRLLFLFVPFFARDSTGVDQPRSRLLPVARDGEREREREREKERGKKGQKEGEGAKNERNVAELDGKASHISPD